MLQFSTVAFVHYSYFAFNCFSAICDFNLAFYNHILYLSLAYQLYLKKKLLQCTFTTKSSSL